MNQSRTKSKDKLLAGINLGLSSAQTLDPRIDDLKSQGRNNNVDESQILSHG